MQENREEKRKERKKEKEGRRSKKVGGWPADQPVAMGGSPCPSKKKESATLVIVEVLGVDKMLFQKARIG